MKWCSACECTRPLSEFNRCASRSDGLDTRCRPCSRARSRQWFLENRERHRAKTAAAQSSRRQATRRRAPWYDSKAVASVYAEAARRRAQGEDVHVDHVVPLRSKLVCGLHVQGNLTVLCKHSNQRKGNRRWPDMPDFCSDSQTVISSNPPGRRVTNSAAKHPRQ